MEARPDPFIRWGNYTDQRWHTLLVGEHFSRPAVLVRKAAQMWASRNGYRCSVAGDDRRVNVQFLPRED